MLWDEYADCTTALWASLGALNRLCNCSKCNLVNESSERPRWHVEAVYTRGGVKDFV